MSLNLVKALNSFSGFKGAAMPTDPTNQEELSALRNAVDGGSCWSGEAPTWSQVSAKITELDAADTAKANAKVSGKAKLKAGEALNDAELSALFG